jgi:hypothetical protein
MERTYVLTVQRKRGKSLPPGITSTRRMTMIIDTDFPEELNKSECEKILLDRFYQDVAVKKGSSTYDIELDLVKGPEPKEAV